MGERLIDQLGKEEWKGNSEGFHLDRSKSQVQQVNPHEAALEQALKDEIMQAPFDVIDDAMDHISALVKDNPNYWQEHPEHRERIDLVIDRFNQYIKGNTH